MAALRAPPLDGGGISKSLTLLLIRFISALTPSQPSIASGGAPLSGGGRRFLALTIGLGINILAFKKPAKTNPSTGLL
jgi:hypothetical protein